jgi:hypothetical protein
MTQQKRQVVSAVTYAAIRERACRLAAEGPLPGPEQVSIVGPLLYPRDNRIGDQRVTRPRASSNDTPIR